MKTALIGLAVCGLTVLAGQTASPDNGPGVPARVVRFSNYDWVVKTNVDRRVGPGPNYFGDDAVEVTPEGLKLKIVERDGRYYCGEVVSRRSFGYGTYRFTLGSNIDRLAPNLVLGLFTWSDDPAYAHRELDVEISRWGDPDNDNGQFVVQPYNVPGNMIRFPVPAGLASSIHEFTWLPGSARFRAQGFGGNAGRSTVKEHTFSRRIPEAGGENARINLWLVSGRPPGAGVTEVIISKFEFSPVSEK